MYKSKGARNLSVQQVKDYFIEHKYATKSEIAKATKLSQATVTNILIELQEHNYIRRVEDCESTGGRKAKCYKICGQYMYFGLLQLQVVKGQVKINYRIVDLDDTILMNKESIRENLSLDALITIINNIKKEYDFQYLSISIPAIVKNGYISKSDIEAFEEMDLKKEIENSLDLEVVIENDVNTAMLGYICLEEIDKHSMAFVYQPDNHHSGCGLYINNTIVYGATNFAGELAFLPNGNLEQQKQILKVEPLSLLIKQVQSIIAIVNPSHIVIYTFCKEHSNLIEELRQVIPEIHLPKFFFINTMEEYIFAGMMHLSIESSRFKI